MGFIDSYKNLEKLCSEMLNDNRGVSAYIDEMANITQGYYVKTWNEDLKKLKHYRWVRNKISHEPGCTEQNMCKFEDKLWLDEFYSRIINRTDPLSLYHKILHQSSTKSIAKHTQSVPTYTPSYTKSNNYIESDNSGCSTVFVISLFAIVGLLIFILFFQIIK